MATPLWWRGNELCQLFWGKWRHHFMAPGREGGLVGMVALTDIKCRKIIQQSSQRCAGRRAGMGCERRFIFPPVSLWILSVEVKATHLTNSIIGYVIFLSSYFITWIMLVLWLMHMCSIIRHGCKYTGNYGDSQRQNISDTSFQSQWCLCKYLRAGANSFCHCASAPWLCVHIILKKKIKKTWASHSWKM